MTTKESLRLSIKEEVERIISELPTEKQINKLKKNDLSVTLSSIKKLFLVERMDIKEAKVFIGSCRECKKLIKGRNDNDRVLMGCDGCRKWHIQGVY